MPRFKWLWRHAIVGALCLLASCKKQSTDQAGSSTAAGWAADRRIVNTIGMTLVLIDAGEFDMGTPPAEGGRFNQELPHHVKITRAFMMATTTVTQEQWKTVMGDNPSHFRGDQRPVETVSWEDAVEFCRKLSLREGWHYRLPTEAEWEYACRAGTKTPFNFGDGRIDDYAWYSANSGDQTHDVATKKPNKWGLYDMHGNVWQWCSDGYGPYGGDAVDPTGAADDALHVMRGGCWAGVPYFCRADNRGRGIARDSFAILGFRVCMDY